jgi:uncharacterized protein YcbK (DUF882 family)
MANQPTMSPDALTGPGRALQGLGRAISGLADGFEAMAQPSDQDKLTAQMAQMDAFAQSQKYYTEAVAGITPDTDMDQWHGNTVKGISSIWDNSYSQVPGYKPLQDSYNLNRQRFVSKFDVDAHSKATGIKTERYAARAFDTFKQSLETVDPSTPEGLAVIDTIGKQLARVPGLDAEAAKAKLAEDLLKRFEAEAAKDPIGAMEKINALKKWQNEFEAQQPQPGQRGQGVGPQSSAKPIMDDSQRKRLAGVDDRVVEKLSLLQGEMGRRFKINSGYRSKSHNARVGGANKSQHIHGNAVDLDVSSLSNEERTAMIAKASALGFTGIGVYKNALHLDIGGRHIGGRRAWGSDYTHKSVPDWARSAIDAHMKGGFASEQVANDVPDYRGKGGPASIRYNNPGAMYPGPSSKKYGAVETKIIGGGHKIAVFPDAVSGAAAQFDLLDRSYTGKTLKSAIAKWSGGNSVSTYLNVIERETGVTPDTVLTKDMVADPRIAIPIAKAMAVQEAGKAYPMNDAQWAQAHQMFAGGGSGTQTASAPPVSERSLTQYAGVPKPTQVADMSGRIGGSEISGRIASRVDQPAQDGARPTNTIPGSQVAQTDLTPEEFVRQQRDLLAKSKPGIVRQSKPEYGETSIRSKFVDKLDEAVPALVKRVDALLGSYVERAEKAAAEGYKLPDEERGLIAERVAKYGTPEIQARFAAAEKASDVTAALKKLTPVELAAQATQLRSAMNTAGANPEIIAKAKAVEGLHTKMVKELSENSVGWAAEAGLIPPQVPITPQTFSVEALQQRKQAVDIVASQYGPEYKQFFSKDERENLSAIFQAGGDPMLQMMGQMYEAFGDEMPKAAAEIAPKAPEAVRAGYLLATGGDEQAVKDIAAFIQRRADPNYKDDTKFDRAAMQTDANEVLSDVLARQPKQMRDATMRAAEAIYMSRVEDPNSYDSNGWQDAVRAAMGEKKNSQGVKYGGVVDTKAPDTVLGRTSIGRAILDPVSNAIVLPSNVRQDTWREMFDQITADDLRAANQPLPVDANGVPLSMTRVVNSTFVQIGPGQYMIARGDPSVAGAEQWVLASPSPQGAAKTDAAAPLRPSEPFILDLKALTPVLRRRLPDLFWIE